MSRYIDADALIRNLQERYCRPCKASGLDYNGVKCKSCQFDDEIDDIDGFADNSIDIEPKRGEWIEISKEVISIPIKWSESDKRKPIYKVKFRCSECGFQKSFIDWHTAQYNYCPNCGCAMTKE